MAIDRSKFDPEVLAYLASLEARAEAAESKAEALAKAARSQGGLKFKVSKTGTVSVYGINAKFPVSLHGSQWEKLFAVTEEIRTFMHENERFLSSKDPEANAKAIHARFEAGMLTEAEAETLLSGEKLTYEAK